MANHSRATSSPLNLRKRSIPSTSRASTPKTEPDISADDSPIVVVSRFGDVLLDVSKEGQSEHVLFKVDSSRLMKQSKYFAQLLDPNGFLEGRALLRQREQLLAAYPDLSAVPDEDLPRTRITDIGQTSQLKSLRFIMTDFLRIVHGYDILTAAKSPPSVNIANLAVLADRFDAKEPVGSWVNSRKNWAPRILATLPTYDEEIYRQRLLTCLILENALRLPGYTTHMIMHDSVMWHGESPVKNTALWWDLPLGIEDELHWRRLCVIDTILSLQDFIVQMFTSKARQCRLGYDSSPQCDSFQLGELVRFLTRIGILRVAARPLDTQEPDWFSGDLHKLIKDLRACPSYQVDANHSHCGPKKLLVAGLDFIESCLGEASIGICHKCWQSPGSGHSWRDAKRLPFYNRAVDTRKTPGVRDGCDRISIHDNGRDFFMAVDRLWSSLLNKGDEL